MRRTPLWCALLLAGSLASGVVVAAESLGGQAPARAARSVHLQWPAPEANAFYLEAAVEQTTPGSYFMACGWSGGYFGIQELADGGKVALFSVWDASKGDDPKAVSPEQRVEVLHEGEGVRIKRFGGEGTGGQCRLDFPWAIGETVRFLVRAEAQAGKTAYSGWIFDPRQGAWRHLVTFRTRTDGRLLRGLYSFVEDFRRDVRSVDETRRARFFGGWVHASGAWQPLTTARFTASRADWEARDRIAAGVGENGFFLATGGSVPAGATLNAALRALDTPGKPPGDLPALPPAASNANKRSSGSFEMVDRIGIKPTTSSLRTTRSIN